MPLSKLHQQTDDWLLGKRHRIIKPQQSGGLHWYGGGSSSHKKPLPQGFGLKNLTSAAKKLPEVMVKIPKRHGGSNGLQGIQNNLDYISRNGELELENQDGQLISGKAEIRNLINEYKQMGIPKNGNRKEALNIVLSMPPGTNPEKLKNAARAFAQEEFENHHWVMVQHLDTDHPHCHLNVLIEDDYGRRINPRKNDLYQWRLRFAEKLREQGIECSATRRQHRGLYRKADDGVLKHIQKRGGESYVMKRQAENLIKALETGQRPTQAFLKKQLETQKIIVEEYGKLAQELYKLGHPKEARLISVLRKQVKEADMRTNEQIKYDQEIIKMSGAKAEVSVSLNVENDDKER
ncbi:MAG: relaxase/mobilization nuclease domain-containing protein [Neisseriaceae bacterium]|nr:relaxase/mobilization nuclease domain-containing protein [Neisseriaceae bacterium]